MGNDNGRPSNHNARTDPTVDELRQQKAEYEKKYKLLKKNYDEMLEKQKEEMQRENIKKQIEAEVKKALELQQSQQRPEPTAPTIAQFDRLSISTNDSMTAKNIPFYEPPLDANRMKFIHSFQIPQLPTNPKVNEPHIQYSSSTSTTRSTEFSQPLIQTKVSLDYPEREISDPNRLKHILTTDSHKTNLLGPSYMGHCQHTAVQDSISRGRSLQESSTSAAGKSASTIGTRGSPLTPITPTLPVLPSQPSSSLQSDKNQDSINTPLQTRIQQTRTASSPHKLYSSIKSDGPVEVSTFTSLPSTSTSLPESGANATSVPSSSTKPETDKLPSFSRHFSVYEPLNVISQSKEVNNNRLYPNIDSLTTHDAQQRDTRKIVKSKSTRRPKVPFQRPTTRSKDGEMTCPTCFKRFGDQIFLCVNSHSLCQACKDREAVCKICGHAGTDTRNSSMENYIKEITIPCPNADAGCIIRHKPNDMEYHLQVCIFKDIICPINELVHQEICGWTGKHRQLASHFDISHPGHRIGDVDQDLCLTAKDIEKGCQLLHLVRLGPYNFLVHLKIDAEFLWMTIKMYATKQQMLKWTFQFHMWNGVMEYSHTDVCDNAYSDLNVFNRSRSVKLPLCYVKRFINENKTLTYKFFIKNTGRID